MLRRAFLSSIGLSSIGAAALQAQSSPLSRPRLHLSPARIEELRAAIYTTHADIWKLVQAQADKISARTPPVYQETGAVPNDEQLWQRDVGSNLPFPALAWLLTRNQSYLDAARRWSLAACGYPHWGLGTEDGSDLAAGHQLYGLALVYDWLYSSLDPETRATIRRTLVERGEKMFRAAGTAYWRQSYLQNHLWVSLGGLAAAGFALLDDPEAGAAARVWIDLSLEKFRLTEAALGPDGASHEGAGYWSYGVEYLLKFWHMAGDLLGEQPSSGWWPNTAAYRLYMGIPRASWRSQYTIVDLADCPRSDWYGPEYLLRRLAALYRDGYAQGLADELERAKVTNAVAPWLNVIWYDPEVPAVTPAGLPTLRHFEDMGIVSARSDWSGDESLLVFKCGPVIGHEATARFEYDPGSGHVHPDTGHFVLFANGEWLIRDDGYRWKQTDQHNTLLVDGKGQLGEGAMWFRGQEQIRRRRLPRMLQVEAAAELDWISGDATEAYPLELGLKKFVRRLLFLKPDVLIVVDDIETDSVRRLELRFHPEAKGQQTGDYAWLFRGSKAALRLEVLTPEGSECSTEDTPAKDRDGAAITMHAVRLQTTAAVWRNAVALSWSQSDGDQARVTIERNGDLWVFRVGERMVSLTAEASTGT